ncbi:MAG: NAD(P)H-hydrate dehydratase [Planctomycetes bacterium]|nr:NAD(P)H-hydrate dehydratase [Planctomycetota bacterium]
MRLVKKLPKLATREPDSHKGTYGTVQVVAGSRTMNGAAYLCCQGALRCGAGLVILGSPTRSARILAPQLPCCLVQPLPATKNGALAEAAAPMLVNTSKRADVAAIGPGISRDDETKRAIVSLLQQIEAPIVLDADGINNVANDLYAIDGRDKRIVVTPHPREMARLMGFKSTAEVQSNRVKTAMVFAERYDTIVVLKGHETIVTDGDRMFVNPTGNPGMATGGAGDVLTGMIAALIAQGLDTFEASALGVYAHGLAGDLAAKKLGQISMIATDIVEALPGAFQELVRTEFRFNARDNGAIS